MVISTNDITSHCTIKKFMTHHIFSIFLIYKNTLLSTLLQPPSLSLGFVILSQYNLLLFITEYYYYHLPIAFFDFVLPFEDVVDKIELFPFNPLLIILLSVTNTILFQFGRFHYVWMVILTFTIDRCTFPDRVSINSIQCAHVLCVCFRNNSSNKICVKCVCS